MSLEKIEDIRDARRKVIIERAKKVLHEWTMEAVPDTEEIFREVSETLRLARVQKYGPEELTAGPDIESAKEIIIVEGRADVINLLKYGIQNVVAVEGAKIPESIIKLCREKEVTALLDGDRGGDLILKELMQVANIKYVARAPKGREVEDLSSRDVEIALRNKFSARPGRAKRKQKKILVPKQIVETTTTLGGTLEAVLLNKEMKQIDRLPVSELAEKLQETKDVDTVVFDGVITQRLVDVANEKSINYLVAARVSDAVKQPYGMHLLTFADVKA